MMNYESEASNLIASVYAKPENLWLVVVRRINSGNRSEMSFEAYSACLWPDHLAFLRADYTIECALSDDTNGMV